MSFTARFSGKKQDSSAIDRIMKEQSIVYGLWGKQPNGKNAYFVMLIEKAKYPAFQKILEKGEGCNLQEYGEIVYQGWQPPSEEEKQAFREKYGLYEE